MYLRVLTIGIACIASACHSAEPNGELQAEKLAELAQQHLGVHNVRRTVWNARAQANATEVRYERPTGGRFATYRLATNGELQEFVVNGPAAYPYVPVKERRAFIERMMDIAVPAASRAERAWGAKQLDSLWTESVRPLPVQVGDYVFTGIVVRSGKGAHDSFRILAANRGVIGLRYRPQS